MSSVSPPNSTMNTIRRKVRRLTASPSENTLRQSDIDQAVNTFYTQDFASDIKTDILKDSLELFTTPNIDRYRVNINKNINFRQPVYTQGRQSIFFKRKEEFYRIFPKLPRNNIVGSGNGTTTNFVFGVNPIPFLSGEVVLHTKDSFGNSIIVNDDKNNNLELIQYSSETGDTTKIVIGSVDYVTGQFNINFPVAPGASQTISVWVSPYIAGFPQSLLYYNNEIIVRPVPDSVYKLEIETYQTPSRFFESSDEPILQQWWQYIAYGAAIEIMRERQDQEGVQELMEGFRRQQSLVIQRQANEEIGIPNSTIYNSPGYPFTGVGWF